MRNFSQHLVQAYMQFATNFSFLFTSSNWCFCELPYASINVIERSSDFYSILTFHHLTRVFTFYSIHTAFLSVIPIIQPSSFESLMPYIKNGTTDGVIYHNNFNSVPSLINHAIVAFDKLALFLHVYSFDHSQLPLCRLPQYFLYHYSFTISYLFLDYCFFSAFRVVISHLSYSYEFHLSPF